MFVQFLSAWFCLFSLGIMIGFSWRIYKLIWLTGKQWMCSMNIINLGIDNKINQEYSLKNVGRYTICGGGDRDTCCPVQDEVFANQDHIITESVDHPWIHNPEILNLNTTFISKASSSRLMDGGRLRLITIRLKRHWCRSKLKETTL